MYMCYCKDVNVFVCYCACEVTQYMELVLLYPFEICKIVHSKQIWLKKFQLCIISPSAFSVFFKKNYV